MAREGWRPGGAFDEVRDLPAGRTLRVETLAPAVVRWSADGTAGGGAAAPT
jgi:hypothetical protein